MPTAAAVLGIGTALPAHRVTQTDAARFVSDRLWPDVSAARFAQRVFRQAAVATRHACIPDFGGGRATLFSSRRPGTAARMEVYRRCVVPLAADAARRALTSAGVRPDEITHVVVVTCTGFFAPGPDAELVEELGLRRDVARTVVGFMGCFAAFNGLRVAADAVRADPARRVLVVCAELCTLHFRADPAPDNLVAHALFGDGAAAVVVGSEPRSGRSLLRLGPDATSLVAEGARAMAWEIGDDGFRMQLAASVPDRLAEFVQPFLEPLLRPGGPDAVDAWCVHPGGRAILDRLEQRLPLPRGALDASRAVLRDVGNVSSASVLFVLERELARLRAGQRAVLLGFGPGLTLEAWTFVRSAAPHRAPERRALLVEQDA